MKYTIVIPTMWRAIRYLFLMCKQYQQSELVGEILIINNDKHAFVPTLFEQYKKVRILNNGMNLFVNPSWNLGTKEAKFEKVILINDDIYVQDIQSVFKALQGIEDPKGVIGFGINCFSQKRKKTLGELRITNAKSKRQYGFGVFMCFTKKEYVMIPEKLKVWYGDSFLYNKLVPYIIDGVDVQTKMGKTSKTLNLQYERRFEKEYFNNLIL